MPFYKQQKVYQSSVPLSDCSTITMQTTNFGHEPTYWLLLSISTIAIKTSRKLIFILPLHRQ